MCKLQQRRKGHHHQKAPTKEKGKWKTVVETAKDPKIWTKVTVRVHDEVSRLIPNNDISKEGQSQNKDAEFASPNLVFIEVNYGRSDMSTMSFITAALPHSWVIFIGTLTHCSSLSIHQ